MVTVVLNGHLSRAQYPPPQEQVPSCRVCGARGTKGYWFRPKTTWFLVGLCGSHAETFEDSGEYVRIKLWSCDDPRSIRAFVDFVERVQAEERHGWDR